MVRKHLMFLPSNNKCKSFQKTLKEKTLKYYETSIAAMVDSLNKNVRHIDFRGNINTGSIAFGGLSDRGSETVKEVWL